MTPEDGVVGGVLAMTELTSNGLSSPERRTSTRRDVLAATAGGSLLALAPSFAAARETLWPAFRRRFVAQDGRVIDTYNNGISHSEGQGYGLLLAAAFGDRETFQRMWHWTRARLQRPDNLFYWKWDPNQPEPIIDPNTATDGDILIAWAKLRAGAQWREHSDLADAADIVAAIERYALARFRGASVILPGAAHFLQQDKVTLNPSYYVFPALEDFMEVGGGIWRQVFNDGVYLIEAARFGMFGLPPDWIEFTSAGQLRPAPGRPPRFGYDAIRIPLYLLWSRTAPLPFLEPFEGAWQAVTQAGAMPDWIDVAGDYVSSANANNGIRAVRRAVRRSLSIDGKPRFQLTQDDNYYSAALVLMAAIALNERRR